MQAMLPEGFPFSQFTPYSTQVQRLINDTEINTQNKRIEFPLESKSEHTIFYGH